MSKLSDISLLWRIQEGVKFFCGLSYQLSQSKCTLKSFWYLDDRKWQRIYLVSSAFVSSARVISSVIWHMFLFTSTHNNTKMCQAVWNINKSKISKSDLTRCSGVFLIKLIYSRCLFKEPNSAWLGGFNPKVTSIQTFGAADIREAISINGTQQV